MRYHGNEVCCCSYACMNAIQDEGMDPQLFEISTSAPFGIRHFKNPQFDRLLTTWRDPNAGVDAVLEMWGCQVEKYETTCAGEVVEYIRKYVREGRLVLGPIDMGYLSYQIMPELLRRMDHYITLAHGTDDTVFCTDSEGYFEHELSIEQLSRCINVSELPEAKGVITIRKIKKAGRYRFRMSANSVW